MKQDETRRISVRTYPHDEAAGLNSIRRLIVNTQKEVAET